MQPSYSTRLTPQQLEAFAEMEVDSSESGESEDMTILSVVGDDSGKMTEEEAARQLTESLTVDAEGAGKFVTDADVIAAFRLLWQSDPTYCERKTAALREKSDNTAVTRPCRSLFSFLTVAVLLFLPCCC